MKRKKTKAGKLILNGVKPESHELDILLFFTNLGKDIELIVPSLTPNSKNADFIMDGIIWEMKSPTSNERRSMERAFYEASCQSSNLVFDLRRVKNVDEHTKTLTKCFKNTRKVRKLYIITSDTEPSYFAKK